MENCEMISNGGQPLVTCNFIIRCRYFIFVLEFEFLRVTSLLQALMYPLLVACKSISNLRKAAAQEVVDKVRQHSGALVD